jgi:hypothetical protein
VIIGHTPRPNGPAPAQGDLILATAKSHLQRCRFRGWADGPAVSGGGTGGRDAHHRSKVCHVFQIRSKGGCHSWSMPSKASSPTSTPSMQPSPNQLSDMAGWCVMYRQGSGSRPYATPLGEDSSLGFSARGGGYWPRLAVAYATGQGPIDSVHRSWFRSVAGLSWRVGTVAFVELRRSPGRYLWDVLAEVPIGRLGH